jgi:hypothetical protein
MSRSMLHPAWPLASALCATLLLAAACGPAPAGDTAGLDPTALAAARRAPVILTPAVPFPTEGFGHAVAVSGTAVAVADFLDSDHADVHTYWLDGATAWPTGTVAPADRAERCFGASLAFQDGRLAVGSPCALAGRGEVRVYAPAGGGWVEEAALGAQAGATGLFGRAVAAGQGRLVIGAPAEGADAGAAYVFALGASGWTLEARLAPADAAPGDQFGFEVAVSPTVIAVAAPGRAGAGPLAPSGRVFVYHLGRGGWVEEAVLAPADTAIGERTARAVAAGSGVVAVAGDPFVAHSLHVFRKVDGAWVEEDVEPELRGAVDAGFVHALAMDGNLLVAGMPTLAGAAGEYRPGAAWVYRKAAAGWTRLAPVPSVAHAYDKSGHAVAVSRGVVVVGGPGTYQAGVSAGSGEVTIERR